MRQDVLIALSKSGPDVIKKEWISRMADNAIVFVCANPIPEIWPWEAKEAGARIVATGRSDFPNQVNNSIGFPAIFRGTLDVMARTITDEMCLAAAAELARCAEDRGLSEDHLLPTMDEWEVFPREAVAVAKKAIEQGVARLKLSEKELFSMAESKIRTSEGRGRAPDGEGHHTGLRGIVVRELSVTEIAAVVERLFVEANTDISGGTLERLQAAMADEESPAGKEVLGELLENAKIAQGGGHSTVPGHRSCGPFPGSGPGRPPHRGRPGGGGYGRRAEGLREGIPQKILLRPVLEDEYGRQYAAHHTRVDRGGREGEDRGLAQGRRK